MRPNTSIRPRHCAGFTLVEAIIVIVITGILAGIVAVFIKGAVDAYIDSARRAELTDVADTAVRRIARDIHLALPNSVRNPSNDSDQCVEFIPTKIGARYRMAKDSSGSGDELDFSGVDSSFDMLWLNSALPATMQIAAGDVVAIYNDGSGNSDCSGSVGVGTAGGNAYCGYNAIQVASVAPVDATTSSVTFVGTGTAAPFNRKQLPGESPYYRFQVITSNEHVVAYVCNANALYRYSRTLSAVRPVPADCSAMAAGATAAILAENVDSCSLKYEPPGSSTGFSMNGILQISLMVTQLGESVKLYHQVHVDNTP
ncbi:MAG: prepilin-type N-terminal cleavage/methylation domain-containing protein [Gallionella sp.]|nr:prepilin-type N-terminal cleavage/methylation domain-containing protein [Gallionella sp.]